MSNYPRGNFTYDAPGKISKTGDLRVDGLLGYGRWSPDQTLTYSFPTSSSIYANTGYSNNDPETEHLNFFQFNNNQKKATYFALDKDIGGAAAAGFSVEGFTNLKVNFDSTADTGTPETFRFGNTNSPTTPYAGHARPGWGGGKKGGDVWIDADYVRNPVAGEVGWRVLHHELGHALGLTHAVEALFGFPAVPTNSRSIGYTVMDGTPFPGAKNVTAEKWGDAQSWMMLDIAALQHLYGANYTVNSGNTTYKWYPNSGNTYVNGQIAIQPGANKIYATIWDGGGTDTYDLSAYRNSVWLDLNPGVGSKFSSAQVPNYSNGGEANTNIYNALLYKGNPASLIENAIGGSGGDTIIGNIANNSLSARAGNDTVYGNNGNDTLYGDGGNDALYGGNGDDYMRDASGADRFDGGAGADTVSYFDVRSHVYTNLKDGGNNQGDTFRSIENLMGSNYANDLIFGSDGNNTLWGAGGNDELYGERGHDKVYGGNGNDRVVGWYGNDTLYGDNGDDKLFGEHDNDQLYGGAGNDQVFGQQGNDTINGDVGNDTLYGYIGNDRLNGGSGNDTLYGENDNDTLDGGGGNDRLYGGAGNDYLRDDGGRDYFDGGAGTDTASFYGHTAGVTINLATGNNNGGDTFVSIENLEGSNARADNLTGNNWANSLKGNGGNDRLEGLGGNDTLHGGAGDDVIRGGAGRDVMHGEAGNDTIYYDKSDSFLDVNKRAMDIGGSGRDTLVVEAGSHFSTAGLNWYGFEVFKGAERADNVRGQGTTNFELYGGAGNDTLRGDAGSDRLDGGAGNDELIGGAGNDVFYGGTGNDTLQSDAGNDTLSGGAGTDQFNLSGRGNVAISDFDRGSEVIKFASGFNTYADIQGAMTAVDGDRDGRTDDVRIQTANGTSTTIYNVKMSDLSAKNFGMKEPVSNGKVDGTSGNDNIGSAYTDAQGDKVHDASAIVDKIYGYGGNDTINAYAGNDIIDGGDGNDMINGGAGKDMLYGGAGNDTLNGDQGINTLYGGSGNDTLQTTIGRDILSGGAGTDQFALSGRSFATITDFDKGSEVIKFSSGFNTYADIQGAMTAVDGDRDGRTDDVRIQTDKGTSTTIYNVKMSDLSAKNFGMKEPVSNGKVDGTSGNDSIGYRYVDAQGDRVHNDANIVDKIYAYGGNDSIFAEKGDDFLDGGEGKDNLYGGGGNDQIYGQAGNDYIVGGYGNDYIYGGAGADMFEYWSSDGSDTIADFQDNVDKLRFEEGIAKDFSDLSITSASNGTLIDYGEGTILLSNITSDLITEDDVQFFFWT